MSTHLHTAPLDCLNRFTDASTTLGLGVCCREVRVVVDAGCGRCERR